MRKEPTRKTIPKVCLQCSCLFAARLDQTKIPGKAKFCSKTCLSKAGGYAATSKYWKYADNYELKPKADKEFGKAVRQGILINPHKCEFCESFEYVDGHHLDYAKALEVIWLCAKCHLNWHMQRI